MPEVNPHLEVMPAWVRAGIRVQVPMAELHETFGPVYEKVSQAVTFGGGDIIGPAYACYFGEPTEVVDVEIGFGIAEPVISEDLIVTQVPSAEVVVGIHIGPYEQLEDSYEKLVPWMVDNDIDLADHMYELYDTMPGEDPAGPITRLVFPLR
jgi:effector-binding domain-containing protein